MAFTKALFYPTIEIPDIDWLKSATLYWDNIQTIVPESISKPYHGSVAETLHEAGILTPFVVKSNSNIVRDLADDAIKYISSNEAKQLLLAGRRYQPLHSDKLPINFRIHLDKLPEEFRVHSDKMAYVVRERLRSRIDNNGWFQSSPQFAAFYMSLLANAICESKRLALLSDNSLANSFVEKVKLDNEITAGNFDPYDYRNRNTTLNLAEGMLTNLIVQGVRLKPATSIKKIIKFKNDHKDELGLFRANIGKLVSSVPANLGIDAVRQFVNDVYTNEFLPSLNNFTKSLDGNKIKWNFETVMKITVISAAGTTLLPTLGLSTPQALFSSIGLSIVGSKIVYNVEKRQKIRESPYSYLMLADKTLNATTFRDFVTGTIL